MQQASWVLPGSVDSVARARALLTDALSAMPNEPRAIALLLTHELVANAVMHGQGQVRLRASWDGTAVRIEVEDDSPAAPVLREVDPEAPTGRGVMFVDMLASDWGVLPTSSGKVVWFTV